MRAADTERGLMVAAGLVGFADCVFEATVSFGFFRTFLKILFNFNFGQNLHKIFEKS